MNAKVCHVKAIWGAAVLMASVWLPVGQVAAATPEYHVSEKGLVLTGVSADCPVIYDNDWWTDVPDAAYIWAQASLGRCRLKGNIITRCTFGWETGYAHSLEQQTSECARLLAWARASGLRNIPEPTIGAREALRPPASRRIEDTPFLRTPGSDLLVAEAHRASKDRPLVVFAGGSCTTIACAYLADPSVADRMIVFQIDGGGYNGSDAWAWKIVMERCVFANWARGYFWEKVSTWKPERFNELPQNPLCDFLRDYAFKGHGKANQWGDGPWVFWMFDSYCLTRAVDYGGVAITVPPEGTNVKAMEDEFFRTMKNPAVYGQSLERGEIRAEDEAGFLPLFSEVALKDWRQCGPGRFVVKDGVATGEGGMGLWWYSGRQFGDFVLRGEFVQKQDIADSGVFLRFPDPGNDPWNAAHQGHEMEIGDPEPNDPTWRTGSIYPFCASRRANTKPPGQWNEYEITCVGHTYTVRINGEQVLGWTDPNERALRGHVGLQNYNDDKTVRHRNFRVRPLP